MVVPGGLQLAAVASRNRVVDGYSMTLPAHLVTARRGFQRRKRARRVRAVSMAIPKRSGKKLARTPPLARLGNHAVGFTRWNGYLRSQHPNGFRDTSMSRQVAE